MKKYLKMLLFLLIFLPISTNIVYASSGALKKKSIKLCPDGNYYGYHSSDNHWHLAKKEESSSSGWMATGEAIYEDPCPYEKTSDKNNNSKTINSNENKIEENASNKENETSNVINSSNEKNITKEDSKTSVENSIENKDKIDNSKSLVKENETNNVLDSSNEKNITKEVPKTNDTNLIKNKEKIENSKSLDEENEKLEETKNTELSNETIVDNNDAEKEIELSNLKEEKIDTTENNNSELTNIFTIAAIGCGIVAYNKFKK